MDKKEIQKRAAEVRDEYREGANTSTKVGGLMYDALTYLSDEVDKFRNFKGYYESLSALQSSITKPAVGNYAYVGPTYPGNVYRYNASGWTNTGTAGSIPSVNLAPYAKVVDLNATNAQVELKAAKADLETAQTKIVQLEQKPKNLNIIKGAEAINSLISAVYVTPKNQYDDLSNVVFTLKYVSYNTYAVGKLGAQISYTSPLTTEVISNVFDFPNWICGARLEREALVRINASVEIPVVVTIITSLNNIASYPNTSVEATLTHSAVKDIFTPPSVYALMPRAKSVDKYSSNLFNKDDNDVTIGKLINQDGTLGTIGQSPQSWFTTGYIDLKEEIDSIIVSLNDTHNRVYCFAFYDEFKAFITSSYKFVYNTGFDGICPIIDKAKYIRLTVGNYDKWQVNKGTVVLPYEPYFSTSYKLTDADAYGQAWKFKPDIEDPDLQRLLNVAENVSVDVFSPRKIYTVCNDITKDEEIAGKRNYAVGLYLDHTVILPAHTKARFELTQSDKFPIYSHFTSYGLTGSGRGWIWNEDGSVVKQTPKIAKLAGIKNTKEIAFTQISTLNTSTAGKTAIVMGIGDSVTAGYLADKNRPYAGSPKAYWQWAKMFFEFDKHQAGSGYESLFVGQRLVEKNITAKYYDGTEIKFNACAEGQGGAKLSEYLRWRTVGGATNNFYDETKQTPNKFSILHYISKFRTMDDMGVRLSGSAGQIVTGSDGKQYTIGTEVIDVNAWDVCTPTHFVIQLGYNDGDRSGYIEDMTALMDILQTEIPNCKIAFSLPDCPGTYFPELYPQYGRDSASMYPLSYFEGNAKESHATFYSMNKKLIEIENIDIKRYYLPTYFISPTALSAPYRSHNFASFLSSGAYEDTLGVQGWGAPNLHPNNHAHAAWGYELYAWIKYTLAI